MIRRLIAVFAVCAAPVAADYDPSQYPAYETCALCHGLFGVSHTAKFPHLGGQKPTYIAAQLKAFLAGDRTNDGGQMAAIVTELHPEDFAVVIDWFSGQDPPPPGAAPPDATGARLVEAAGCLTCHVNGADGADHVPHLTAQHAGYLVKQMQDFREERRTHGDTAALHRDLLNEAEAAAGIDAIAAYLSSVERAR